MFALGRLEKIQRPANVHFTESGSEVLAEQVAASILAALGKRPQGEPEQIDVFVSGQDGYHTYRIPSVIVTSKGSVLAFCEGRKQSRSDTGDIDLLLKRSPDGGKSWSPAQIVWDDGDNTCGNPCPVIDRETGTIWLLLTHNLGQDKEAEIVDRKSDGTRTAWVSKSDDDGATWAKPVEITRDVKGPDWTWYATGPGCGIQLKSGRLLIPCDHIVAGSKIMRSHVIYSDDHGATWKLGGVLGDHTNECQIAERSDGSLILNMRSYYKQNRRAIATSRDGGITWSEVTLDSTLVEPVCQASLVQVGHPNAPAKDLMLFSNPASTKREKLTVRLSHDGGRTWPVSKLIHAGPSAYSALTVLPDMTIGCLYERGENSPYEKIAFARFSLEWLAGQD
ncbi:MAG: exo-alpha-sialidase [Planctomycetes bacterium]|nr:exo-alpha-sialidase [Planctomycetota bacterium]